MRERTGGNLFGSFALAWLGAAVLIGWMINAAGVWRFLSWTRLLDLFIVGGIVRLHDAHAGYIEGVPSLELYQYSQDPIDFRLMLLCGIFFLLAWTMDTIKFHDASRFAGATATYGRNARAWLYGSGADRFMPFRFGTLATAEAMKAQGATEDQAKLATFTYDVLQVVVLVIMAAISFAFLGATRWVSAMVWPFAILGASYLLVRRRRKGDPPVLESDKALSGRRVLGAVIRQPLRATRMLLLGILSFLFVEAAFFSIMMAFTSVNVILTFDTELIMTGLVGYYIARMIPLTPGGLGQGEWAFAAAVYWAGAGLPEGVVIALLAAFIRYIVGMITFGVVALGAKTGTNLNAIIARFRAIPDAVPGISGGSR